MDIFDEKYTKLSNVEVEEALIGFILADVGNRFFKDVRELLPSAACFDDRTCSEIWKAMLKLDDDLRNMDIMSVYVKLQELGSAIVPAMLARLASRANSGSDAVAMAKYLRAVAERRNFVQGMQKAVEDALVEDDLTVAMATARKTLQTFEEERATGITAISQPMIELLMAIEDRVNGKEEESIYTDFCMIDEKGGLHPTDLNIIAGATSMGKTSFGLCVLKNVAAKGVPCAVYSLEMSSQQLCARLIAQDGDGVSSSELMYQKLDAPTYSKVITWGQALSTLPIYFDESSVQDLDGLCASIRNIVYQQGVRVVLVDYIQLLKVRNIADDVKAMADAARELKNLAKQLNIVVIALSQLSRPREDRSPVPTLSKLRGSGGIEEAADNVYLIYRPEYYKKDFPGGWSMYSTKDAALLIRAKGRNIGVAERLLKFTPATTKYVDWKEATEQAVAERRDTDKPWYE